MDKFKIIIPFVDVVTNIAYQINDIIELDNKRGIELEKKGLVAKVTNPKILTKNQKINSVEEAEDNDDEKDNISVEETENIDNKEDEISTEEIENNNNEDSEEEIKENSPNKVIVETPNKKKK